MVNTVYKNGTSTIKIGEMQLLLKFIKNYEMAYLES